MRPLGVNVSSGSRPFAACNRADGKARIPAKTSAKVKPKITAQWIWDARNASIMASHANTMMRSQIWTRKALGAAGILLHARHLPAGGQQLRRLAAGGRTQIRHKLARPHAEQPPQP